MNENTEQRGSRYGMVIDLALCVGCNACTVACKMENETPTNCFDTWVESWDAGNYPTVFRANLPKLCNHCENAPCISVCPTGATYRDENGVVLVDHERCIGCKYCMAACPYQVRWQDPVEGHVDKCTFCHHRIEDGLLPACTASCITHARVFGDLNDPKSDVSRKLLETNGEVLLEELGCNPSVYYVGLSHTTGLPRTSVVHRGGNKDDRNHN